MGKKFKLIKEYPGSTDLESVAIHRSNYLHGKEYSVKQSDGEIYLSAEVVENYDEFWKEVESEPIFVTEDNVKLFSSECTVFGVLVKANWQTNYYNGYGLEVKHAMSHGKDWKWFSTKETAEKYIEKNKPRFSVKDIEDAFMNSPYTIIGHNVYFQQGMFGQKLGI